MLVNPASGVFPLTLTRRTRNLLPPGLGPAAPGDSSAGVAQVPSPGSGVVSLPDLPRNSNIPWIFGGGCNQKSQQNIRSCPWVLQHPHNCTFTFGC